MALSMSYIERNCGLSVENGEEAVSPGTQRFYSTLTSSLTEPAFLGIQPRASSTQCPPGTEETDNNLKHTEAVFKMMQGQLSVSRLKSEESPPLFPEGRLTAAWCLALD